MKPCRAKPKPFKRIHIRYKSGKKVWCNWDLNPLSVTVLREYNDHKSDDRYPVFRTFELGVDIDKDDGEEITFYNEIKCVPCEENS